MKPIILFVACLFTTLVHAQTKINMAAEKQKLQKILDDWAVRATSENLDSSMYYWANNAIILDHGKLVNGKDAIKQMMLDISKMHGSKIKWDDKPSTLEISNSGDMAYMIFGNSISMTDSTGKTISVRNTALETWEKDTHGMWKCAVVMMMPDAKQ